MERSSLGQCFHCAQPLACEAVCLENVDLLRHCTVRLEGLRGLSVLLRVLATATLLDGRSGGGAVCVFSPFTFREMFGMPNTPQGKRCRRPGGCRRSRFAQLLGQRPRLDVASAARGNGITRVIARVGKLPWAGVACMPRVLRGTAHQLSDGVAGRVLAAAATVRYQLQPSGSGFRAGFPEQPARRHDLVRGRQRGHRAQRRGGAVQTARGGRPGGGAAARPGDERAHFEIQTMAGRTVPALVAPCWITCGRCLAGKGRSGPSLPSGRGRLQVCQGVVRV